VRAVVTKVSRRAERFAQLLDEASGKPRRHSRTARDDELTGYLALSRRISDVELSDEASPSQDFRSSLRAMLIANAEREGIGGTAANPATPGRVYAAGSATTPRRRPVLGSRRTRGAIIVGIAAGTLALSGMSMASGDAMPGDPLYGVKRSTESAQLALAGSDVDKGQTYLGFARNRGREATAVHGNSARLIPVLGDMDNQTTQGVKLLTTVALTRHDSTALDAVDGFVKAQRPVVAALLPSLSGSDRARAQRSLDLIDQIGQRSAGLRGSLSCGPSATESDALGPKPPDCPGPSRTGQNRPGSSSPTTGP
jgi:hypothetical protein